MKKKDQVIVYLYQGSVDKVIRCNTQEDIDRAILSTMRKHNETLKISDDDLRANAFGGLRSLGLHDHDFYLQDVETL